METMIMGFPLRDVLGFFFVYSFLGWCAEVAFHAVTQGRFVNRGFLNGPICPIYGVGMTAIILFLTPLKGSFFALFLGGALLCSVLEYVTGYLMEKLFHQRWWDYSDEPFNLNGYICLSFSLVWGVAVVLIMKLVHPLIYNLLRLVPHVVGNWIVLFFLALFVADSIATVQSVLKFNKRLRLIDEIARKIRENSDSIGGVLSDEVLELKVKLDRAKSEGRYTEKRLMKAFPNLKNEKYDVWVTEMKEKYQKKKKVHMGRRDLENETRR